MLSSPQALAFFWLMWTPESTEDICDLIFLKLHLIEQKQLWNDRLPRWVREGLSLSQVNRWLTEGLWCWSSSDTAPISPKSCLWATGCSEKLFQRTSAASLSWSPAKPKIISFRVLSLKLRFYKSLNIVEISRVYFSIYSEFIFNRAANVLLWLHGTLSSDLTSEIDLRWSGQPEQQQEDTIRHKHFLLICMLH